jgi:C4-dicarboxylate-binding protein DctP
MTVSNHKGSTYPLVVNKAFWDGLSQDKRAALEGIIKEARGAVQGKLVAYDTTSLDAIKKEGKMEIYTLTPQEQNAFKEVLMPLYDKYQDQIGKKYIDAAKSLQ